MAESTKIIWMPTARENFLDLIAELYDHSPLYSENWSQELEKKVDRLKDFPLIGRIVPEKQLSFFREIFVGRYRVMYCVMPETIYVMTIQHMSSSITNL